MQDFRDLCRFTWPLDTGEWPITWLTTPKHAELAFARATYGNAPSIGLTYSAAAILAVIPPWEKRKEKSGSG